MNMWFAKNKKTWGGGLLRAASQLTAAAAPDTKFYAIGSEIPVALGFGVNLFP